MPKNSRATCAPCWTIFADDSKKVAALSSLVPQSDSNKHPRVSFAREAYIRRLIEATPASYREVVKSAVFHCPFWNFCGNSIMLPMIVSAPESL
jgi:hypothetical protein